MKLVAGIINYRDYEAVPACLEALRRSSRPPERVLVADNSSVEPEAARLAQLVGRENLLASSANRGYAGGANAIIRAAAGAELILLLNPDVEVEPGFCEALLRAAEAEPRAAALQGKLLRTGKQILDSTGVRAFRSGRNRDRAGGEPDDGRFSAAEEVFGATGAASLWRRTALAELEIDGEFFDEDFLVYHEDNDLCWRARLLGWKVLYVPEAQAVHARGYQAGARARASRFVRHHAFKNHYLKLAKNLLPAQLWRFAPQLLGWECARLGYALAREPFLWRAWLEALRLLPRAWRKRREIMRRRRASEMELRRWFE
jgi:GT2 family glycosyltransferase